MSGLFDVDIAGYRQTLVDDAPRILMEPISNAFDTEAKNVTVEWSWSRGVGRLRIEDDDPDGFAQLRDAYTLFAPSTRKGDAEKRGRFGLGEKEFIALCYPGPVVLESTTGTVSFEGDERKIGRTKRPTGTVLVAQVRIRKEEAQEFEERLRLIMPPEGVRFRVIAGGVDREQPRREPVREFKATLGTVLDDGSGDLRRTRRQTMVYLHEPQQGETPMIFELGIPVVEHDGRFHVNVMQKVPLGKDRDNVPPGWLRTLREYILNESYRELTSVDAKKAWVTEALPNASADALRKIVHEIHGPNAVIFDPAHPESNKRAAEQGRPIVYGRQFTTETWKQIREHQILEPAGRAIPVGIEAGEDGKPPIPPEDWTANQRAVADYAVAVGEHLLGFAPAVKIANITVFESGRTGHFAAWYGSRTITFNVGRLGKRWFDEASEETIDDLLLHEFSHEMASDHLSDAYHQTCTRLGAKLRSCPVHLERP